MGVQSSWCSLTKEKIILIYSSISNIVYKLLGSIWYNWVKYWWLYAKKDICSYLLIKSKINNWQWILTLLFCYCSNFVLPFSSTELSLSQAILQFDTILFGCNKRQITHSAKMNAIRKNFNYFNQPDNFW